MDLKRLASDSAGLFLLFLCRGHFRWLTIGLCWDHSEAQLSLFAEMLHSTIIFINVLISGVDFLQFKLLLRMDAEIICRRICLAPDK